MANYKEINWDVIRAEYVMSNEYPSYDELATRHGVSKPLIIEKANNRQDVVNNGSTWMEQRENYIAKKRSSEEDTAIAESKKMIKKVVTELNDIGLKAFKLVSNDLDYLLQQQEEYKARGEMFPVYKYVKIGDVAKIAESLHKLTGSQGAKEMVLRLQVDSKQKSLQDLSDKELEDISKQASTGQANIIDAEYEEV